MNGRLDGCGNCGQQFRKETGPFQQRAIRKEVLTIDNAIARLESFYINAIVMEYGEQRGNIIKCQNELEKIFEANNNILETEDRLRESSDTMSSNEFTKKFDDLEEMFGKNRLVAMKQNDGGIRKCQMLHKWIGSAVR